MKIVVCAKQVPDTNEVKIDPVKGTLIREGVPSILNPDDANALEAALALKDKNVDTEVIVVTMGPPQAQYMLRECLAMGADSAILLSDRGFGGADTWATSNTIAGALRNLDFDLIVTGRQAIDGDTAQVGPQIAEHLKLPQVSYVENVDPSEGYIRVKRQFEDRYHVLKVQLPCLITTLSELSEPRYMSIGKIRDAYEKEITVWGLKDIEDKLDKSNLGLKGSPTRVKKSFPKSGKGEGEKYDNLNADEAAQKIVEKLKEKYII